MFKNKLGFTLLELLVVVLIIGILAAIALPRYRKATAKAELSQLLDLEKTISNAQERYFLLQNSYSGSISKLDVDIKNSNNINCYSTNSNYVICYNKNFALIHYYQVSGLSNLMECFARNKNFAFACEALLGKNSSLDYSGPCDYIGGKPCYKVHKYMAI